MYPLPNDFTGSANEADHWLHTAIDCQIGHETEAFRLIEINNKACKILNAAIRTLGKCQRTQPVRESPPPYSLSSYPFEENDS